MSEGDRAVIVLLPSGPEYDGSVVPGAVRIVADCGCPAWIGQTSKAAVDSPFHSVLTVCLRHAGADALARLVEGRDLHALPGQREELAEAMGELYARRVWKELDVTERTLGGTDDDE